MGGRRAVVEHVSQMAATVGAMHFGPDHAMAAVDGCLDRALDRVVEARPAGAAFELQACLEQLLLAPCAGECAGAFFPQKGAGPRCLGPMRTHHVVLFRSEDPAPLRVAMRDRECVAWHREFLLL